MADFNSFDVGYCIQWSGLAVEGHPYTLSDGALAAMTLYKSMGRNILKMLRTGEHGRLLEELGFGDDLQYSAGVDSVPVLPVMEGNVVKLKREPEKRDRAATGPLV